MSFKTMTPELKATLLAAVKDSLMKSTVGSQGINGINVGDEITLVDIITTSNNPNVTITPENPQYVFETANHKQFTVSGNGIPAMRVLAAGKTENDLAGIATLTALRDSPSVEFFKQAMESLDPGKQIDITAVKFKCVSKVVNPEAVDASRPAMVASCYQRYDDYREEMRQANPDYTAARVRLHSSGIKPAYLNKSVANAADARLFQWTPVFSVNWGQ